MQTTERITFIIVLVVTIFNTIYGLPTWNNLKGAPPTFVKPMVLPASFARSTLSNELLSFLKQSRSDPMTSPNLPAVSRSPPANSLQPDDDTSAAGPTKTPVGSSSPPASSAQIPSSVLEKLLTSYDQRKASPAPDGDTTTEPKTDLSGTLAACVLPPASTDSAATVNSVSDDGVATTGSQLDRPPSSSDNYGPPNSNPAPVLEPFTLPPESAPLRPEQTPGAMTSPAAAEASPPTPVRATLPSAAGPSCGPGPTLLPIQPVSLPPKFNQELFKLLSDSAQTAPPSTSQKHSESSSLDHTRTFALNFSDPLPAEASTPPPLLFPSPPICSTSPSSQQSPPTTPRQQPSSQLLNLLLNSPSTIQQLKSLLSRYCTSNKNPISAAPTVVSPPCPLPTPNNCLNQAFIKYLSTIPRYCQ